MSATIELTEEELAAVEDGQAALDGLLARLANEPAPDVPVLDGGRTLLPIAAFLSCEGVSPAGDDDQL